MITKTCPICNGTGLYRQYRALGAWNERCGCCKGRKVVSLAKWLKSYSATPETLTRAQAIARCAVALGLDPHTGRVGYGNDSTDYEIAPNGVAGLVVDCDECGHTDVLARFLARWTEKACEGHRTELVAMVAEVRAARQALRAESVAA